MRKLGYLVTALLLFALIPIPPADAHVDGCLIAQHFPMGIQLHMGCTSTPNTCFANAAVGGVKAHAGCEEPETNPCLLKVLVAGQWIRVCDTPPL